MNLFEAISYIENIKNAKTENILHNMKVLLSELSDPQNNLKFVHIAGTNGKGTVTTCLAHILKENGYKVGFTISPYVLDFRERIQVNNEFIEENAFINLVEQVKGILQKLEKQNILLPQFSVITAIALKYFSDKKCDIVCLETGVGGRLDSTNVVQNVLCSVITSISLDHQHILGDNIVDISFEKAGIIKPNVDVVLYHPSEKCVLNIIKKVCKKNKAKLTLAKFDKLRYLENNLNNNIFIYKGDVFRIKYLGKVMPKNIVVVLEVLKVLTTKGFNIDFKMLYKHIYTFNIQGRLEPISLNDKMVILDACHNIGGVKALCKYINDIKLCIYEQTAIVGICKDKDYIDMLSLLKDTFKKIYITTFDSERSLNKTDILSAISALNATNVYYLDRNNIPYDNLKKLNEFCDCFVFCGSFYFIGEVKTKNIK